MIALGVILALVALQRLVELAYAARNTRRLLARGAVEYGAAHYPLVVALHAAWLATIAVVGLRAGHAGVHWWIFAAFVMLQAARVWIIASLGPYWTTRVVRLAGAPLVRTGPYRFLRHPNYVVVFLEIVLLPLVFGQTIVAIVFGLLDLAVMAIRIPLEERSLHAGVSNAEDVLR